VYSTLYKSRQSEAKYLPRAWYYNDALSLPWVRKIQIKRSKNLDPDRVRGLIYASNLETHGGLESLDYNIIIADGMSPAEERFVTIKELMHCYFAPVSKNVKYLTGTEIALENHMSVFFENATAESAQNQAEKMALWMAIGVLCPERDRQTIMTGLKDDKTTIEAECGILKVPTTQVKALISKVYDVEIAKLI